MTNPLRLLAAAGRHGPALLCGGAFVGLAAPPLAEMARPLMGVAVFVFTLGAFLKVDAAAFRAEAADRRALLTVLAWATFGVPLATYGLVQLLRPGPDLSLGLLHWASCSAPWRRRSAAPRRSPRCSASARR